MVIPLRDEAAISLGTDVLPMLFVASLLLTLVAAPICSHILSLPSLPKSKALLMLYRFFGSSSIAFFAMCNWEAFTSSPSRPSTIGELKDVRPVTLPTLQVCFYIWIALLNLFTTSALWTRLADVMSSEAGSRLFGFVGAGATLGQLVGSIFAVIFAPFGSFLLLLSALFMELASRCASRVGQDILSFTINLDRGNEESNKEVTTMGDDESCKEVMEINSSLQRQKDNYSKISSMLQGLRLILASSYLLHVCCFLWLMAVASSFFYFQRANVVAGVAHDSLERRMLLAKINSFTAVFILFGQLTLTGRLLTRFGIAVALCASPAVAFLNMTAISISPIPLVIAISEALRKVTMYVLTKPGREILFTVTSEEEKYKAKVFIDTFVQRLGDAAAAGMYELIALLLPMRPSTIAICALPVCFVWFMVALSLGHRQHAKALALGVV